MRSPRSPIRLPIFRSTRFLPVPGRRGLLTVPAGAGAARTPALAEAVEQGNRGPRLLAAALGVGMALSTATRLRLGGPVGPGELILLAWCVTCAVVVARRRPLAPAPLFRPFALFWFGALVVLLAGSFAGWALGSAGPGALRDFLAYGFVSAITLSVAYRPGGAHEVRTAARIALVTCTLVLFALLLYAGLSDGARWLQLGHAGRFRGWSENPNQVPLAVILTPFLALHGTLRSSRGPELMGRVVLACCAVLVGLSSQSDALVLAWAAGAAVFAGHVWLLAVRSASVPAGMKLLLVAATLLAVALTVLDGRAVERVAGGVRGIYTSENAGRDRIGLLATGIESAAASPLVGLGPGRHARWQNLDHPAHEAHNIFVDWLGATGLLGIVLLGGLLLHVGRSAVRAPTLLAGYTSLLVFGLAHHYLRHPIVWFYFLLIVVLGQDLAAREPETSPVSPRRGV